MARPLMTAAAATGDVKKYQSIIGGILLAIVPIAYVVLKLGGNPTSVYIVHLAICIIAFLARLIIVKPMINLSIRKFFSAVILPCLLVSLLSLGFSFMVQIMLPEGIWYTMIVCAVSMLIVAIFAYSIGLSKGERAFVNSKVVAIFNKVAHHDKNFR
jgi:hypothetical protein